MSSGMVGVKDMHPMQIEALMNFCCHALDMAATLAEMQGDPEIANEAVSMVESLTELFGANAVILQTSHESSDSEPESDLLAQVLRPQRAVGRRGPAEQGPASET